MAKKAKRSAKKSAKSVTTKRKIKSAAKARPAREYPIAETLAWVADGEKLLRKWGAIKSPFAKKIAGGFEKILTVLETVNDLRKM